MQVGEFRKLNKDNTFNKGARAHVWGKKGEMVQIISIRGNAVIYENKKDERFPCNIKDLE